MFFCLQLVVQTSTEIISILHEGTLYNFSIDNLYTHTHTRTHTHTHTRVRICICICIYFHLFVLHGNNWTRHFVQH
jgi:hypothetical protein